LHQEKSYEVKKFIKELSNKSWSLSSLRQLLTKADQTDVAENSSHQKIIPTCSSTG